MKNIISLTVPFLLMITQTHTAVAQKRELAKVSVSAPPIFNAIGLFLAEELGYFEEEGIDADIVTFKSGSEQIVPLLAANKLDIAATGLNAGLYNAINAGAQIILTADAGHYAQTPSDNSIQKIVVSKKAYPGTLDRDVIKGKTFAVLLRGSVQEIFLELFLKRYGLTLNDVDIVSVPFSSAVTALAGGSVFGAPLLEPYLTVAKQKDLVVEIIACEELYPGQQSMALMFSHEFAANREELGVKFMKAYLKGVRYYNDFLAGKDSENSERLVFETLKKYTPIADIESFRQMGKPTLNSDGKLNLESIERDTQWYLDHGYIKSKPALYDIVDQHFIKASKQ